MQKNTELHNLDDQCDELKAHIIAALQYFTENKDNFDLHAVFKVLHEYVISLEKPSQDTVQDVNLLMHTFSEKRREHTSLFPRVH
jgi:hypothetical protein